MNSRPGTTSNRPGVASYDKRMIELWRAGGVRPTQVKIGTRNTAITFRHRMYKLREQMRREKHEDLAVAERAKISLLENSLDPNGWCIVVKPTDADFGPILDAAGFKEEKPPSLDDD